MDDGTVKVVGTMPAFEEDEFVQFTGIWKDDQRYGRQFVAHKVIAPIPKTETEILNYLSSKRVKGIGPGAAKRIVEHFGEATIYILDEEPEKVYDIPGLKQAEVEYFLKQWFKDHAQRHTLIYLQEEVGFNSGRARRVYTKYAGETRRTILTDPYQLVADEFLRFNEVDDIVRRLNLVVSPAGRTRASIIEALNHFSRDSHTYVSKKGVLEQAAQFLGFKDTMALEGALNDLLGEERLREEQIKRENGARPTRAIYLPRFWHAENEVAEKLCAIASRPSSIIDFHRDFSWTQFFFYLKTRYDISSSPAQDSAVENVLTNKISVLTGGPGTGKTTTLRLLIAALLESDFSFNLAAPTGRAARRLSEATDHIDASTIHRLLKWDAETGGFAFNEGNPLGTNVVVIDEASMLDLLLFNNLLKALPLTSHLLLVGDVDQLPSVGAGNVLSDVINSGVFKVSRLTKVFRQDENSHIVSNAHLINKGKMPVIDNQKLQDFWFFDVRDSSEVANRIVDLVTRWMPQRWDLNPLEDIQIIAPKYKGDVGVRNLNNLLQKAFDDGSQTQPVIFNKCKFRVGNKVMQTRNNYDKEVFNGDIGFILSINHCEKSLTIKFNFGAHSDSQAQSSEPSDENDHDDFLDQSPESDVITYQFSDADELELAYCITIHKSQGSEFPFVVMPIHSQQSRMLQRKLLYTAVTRAKQGVVLVGTRNALQQAVNNDIVDVRRSGLLHRLRV